MIQTFFLKLGRVKAVAAITSIAILLSELIAVPIGMLLKALGVYIDFTILLLFGFIIPAIVAPFITWTVVGLFLKIHVLEQKMRKLANYDSLTKVLNRGGFRQKALDYCQLAVKQSAPVSLLEIDLDNFKRINDNYGHLVGDEVLKHFAQICTQASRQCDYIGRLGGEEFAILLPNANKQFAKAFASRLQLQLANSPYVNQSLTLHYSVSIGISTAFKADIDYETMLSLADRALYQAKNNGRDCSVAA